MSTNHPFRFGIINENMTSPEAFITRAQRAENIGYATFLIRDHFVPDFFGDQFAPMIALMAAAMATNTLRIGTMVIDNDYRHPVMLAKEAATLDLLSGGRMELGLGAGWLRTEYEQAGMTFDRAGIRINRLEEAIHIIKGLFTEAPVNVVGKHYSVSNLSGYPKPIQHPRLPIFIGAGKKRMLQLAGREADIIGLLTASVASGTLESDPTERLAESVAQKIDWIRAGAGERFDDIELSVCPTIILTDDRTKQIECYIQQNGWEHISVADVQAMPSVFIGSLDEVATDMERCRAQYGFSYFVISDSMMEDCAPIVARMAGK